VAVKLHGKRIAVNLETSGTVKTRPTISIDVIEKHPRDGDKNIFFFVFILHKS